MATESFNDKAISTLQRVEEMRSKMDGISDYGEVTGFCDESELIIQDLSDFLGSIRLRASRLTNRISKYKTAEASKTSP